MNFMGAKIEKFVRDLKKLSHSYMKQPLRRELKNRSCTKFPENLPVELLSNYMGKFSGNFVQLRVFSSLSLKKWTLIPEIFF